MRPRSWPMVTSRPRSERAAVTQRHHEAGLHQLALELDPEAAVLDLARVGALVDAALAAERDLKCLTALVR